MIDLDLLIPEAEILLFPLFNKLRKEAIPLGISDYLLAIKTIKERIGLEDSERLQRFLCLLWVKSPEDQAIFNDGFEALVKPALEQILEETTKPSDFDITNNRENSDNDTQSLSSRGQEQNQPKNQQEIKSLSSRPSASTLSSKTAPIQLRFRKHYNLIPRLPITRREMTVIWRNLIRLQREGVPEELDIQGTIHQICQMGCFLNPVLQSRRKNQVKLVLLIDCEGSMSPFQILMEALQASLAKAKFLHNTSVYYFHNCPRGYLFTQPNLTKPEAIEEIFSQEANDNRVVIISDAGAARRTYNSERFHQTKAFIKTLCGYTYLYGWLNPVPKSQWRTTTAEDIAKILPMYPIDREGLNDLVKILLGYPFPTGVGL